jgi:hypothetical protein
MEASGAERIRADLRRSIMDRLPGPPEALTLQPGESHEVSIDLNHFPTEGTGMPPGTYVIAGYYWPRSKEAAIPAEFLNGTQFADAVLDRIGSKVARIVVLRRPRTGEEEKQEAERLGLENERLQREAEEAKRRAMERARREEEE